MRRTLIRLTIGWLLLAVPACSGDEQRQIPTLQPGGCGLTGYQWLDASRVGEVLRYAEHLLSPMTSATMDSLLAPYTDYFSPLPYGARLWNVRYTTQDKGRLVEATGIISVPWTAAGLAGEFPVVLWLHGTSGFTGECAPSYTGADYVLLSYLFSGLGYVVAAPDFIGLDAGADFSRPPPVKHAWVHIEQTAIGSLDMVRAADSFLLHEGETDVRPNGQIVLWGVSQGGHAAFACDLLQPYYAPELELLAAVAIVPPTDALGLAQYGLSGINDASAAVAAMCISHLFWYEGTEPLSSMLTSTEPWNFAETLPAAMYSGCDAPELFEGVTEITEVFTREFIDDCLAVNQDAWEPWHCYLAQGSIATTSIPRLNETPTLFVLGEEDTLAHTPVLREDFDRLCGLGFRLEYLECAEAGHSEAAYWSLPEQIDWLLARLSGEPLDASRLCRRTTPATCAGQDLVR